MSDFVHRWIILYINIDNTNWNVGNSFSFCIKEILYPLLFYYYYFLCILNNLSFLYAIISFKWLCLNLIRYVLFSNVNNSLVIRSVSSSSFYFVPLERCYLLVKKILTSLRLVSDYVWALIITIVLLKRCTKASRMFVTLI